MERKMNVSEYFHIIRKIGFNQTQIADHLGVTVQTIQRWLTVKQIIPPTKAKQIERLYRLYQQAGPPMLPPECRDTIRRLAALGVTKAELLDLTHADAVVLDHWAFGVDPIPLHPALQLRRKLRHLSQLAAASKLVRSDQLAAQKDRQ
jgi:transcriptional regulator with XRE-family HTH domain